MRQRTLSRQVREQVCPRCQRSGDHGGRVHAATEKEAEHGSPVVSLAHEVCVGVRVEHEATQDGRQDDTDGRGYVVVTEDDRQDVADDEDVHALDGLMRQNH